MKITFLGTGESSDQNNLNISVLVESKINILLDCGFSVPFQLWRYNENPEFLDAIYITHFHADHAFGLPLLLIDMKDRKRKKPFTIIGQKGIKSYVYIICKLAYLNFVGDMEKRKIIRFLEIKDKFNFRGLRFETAKTRHPRPNYSVKITDKGKSIFYSGDGATLKKTKKILKNCDLIVQECFTVNEKKEGHFSLIEILDYFKDINYGKLALVHINKKVRKEQKNKILKMIKGKNIFMPKPMQSLRL